MSEKGDLSQGAYPPAQGNAGGAQPVVTGAGDAYPGAPYPAGAAYPPVYPQGNAAPPVYQPQDPATNHKQDNVTVVIQQPTTTSAVVTSEYTGLGIAGMMLGIVSTILICLCGCWWALPCTIIGAVYGSLSSAAGQQGDGASAKKNGWISLGCTAVGWIVVIVGFIIIIAIAVSMNNTTTTTTSSSSRIN